MRSEAEIREAMAILRDLLDSTFKHLDTLEAMPILITEGTLAWCLEEPIWTGNKNPIIALLAEASKLPKGRR